MKQELIAALEDAGMVYAEESPYYEFHGEISWPLVYEAAKAVAGQPEFAPEFPIEITENSLSVLELEGGLYLDNIQQPEIDAIAQQVGTFISGRYFAHAAASKLFNA